jgi:mutS2 protein
LLYSHLPSLDLHGMDREITRILVNEFIRDHYKMKTERVVIIHGIGTGVLKKTVHEELRKNKLVESFYLDFFNIGSTIVSIKQNI